MLGATLRQSWILGPYWGHFGPSWGQLGPSWGQLKRETVAQRSLPKPPKLPQRDRAWIEQASQSQVPGRRSQGQVPGQVRGQRSQVLGPRSQKYPDGSPYVFESPLQNVSKWVRRLSPPFIYNWGYCITFWGFLQRSPSGPFPPVFLGSL